MSSQYNAAILCELDRIENWSADHRKILFHFSKFLRNKVWPIFGDYPFYTVVSLVNVSWLSMPCSVEAIDAYIGLLGNLFGKHRSELKQLFSKEQNDIQKIAAKELIEKQWKNINAPVGDAASFLSVFDSFYNQCVLKYPDLYLVKSTHTAFLYRACRDINADYDRFIPRPNKTNNRWNPPGKTYLYLSYGTKDKKEEHGLYTVNQHTCMEEMRGSGGEKFAICRFKAKKGLRVLDLSYNDISDDLLMQPMNTSVDAVERYMMNTWLPEALRSQKLVKLQHDKPLQFERIVKDQIHSISERESLEERIYQSIGQQYLKLICDTVFLSIDDEGDKEKQYHSFWDMARYLECKGIDGIIYPSTRMAKKGCISKNLVLFDITSAKPDIKSKQILERIR